MTGKHARVHDRYPCANPPDPLPSRLASDHTSPLPGPSAAPSTPAADPETLARVHAGLLRI
jgi:hypothetical protein